LKIDRSFIHDLIENAQTRAMVNAIIAMCKSLKLQIIAEGIETAEQRDYLLQQGCETGPGLSVSEADTCHRVCGAATGKWANPARSSAAAEINSNRQKPRGVGTTTNCSTLFAVEYHRGRWHLRANWL
jgi:EAL domain-containing protein (putative c-di-GMP-specific phosphodiesterase class I)